MKKFLRTWLLGALVIFGAVVFIIGIIIIIASLTITSHIFIPVGLIAGSLVSSLGITLSLYILDNYVGP